VEDLFNYFKAEKNTKDLLDIPKDIYKRIAKYLSRFEGLEESKDINYLLMQREKELILDIAERLIDIRVEKAEKLGEKNEQILKLTDEEKYIFDALIKKEKRRRIVLEALKKGREKELEKVSKWVSSRTLLVRFLQDLPAIVGSDMKSYGPFKKEDIANLPYDNAIVLIKGGMAEEVIAIELDNP